MTDPRDDRRGSASPGAEERSERLYGAQAETFDARRGLADSAPEWIARAALQLHGAGGETEFEGVLELGAGTGEIGVALARHAKRYVGVESSSGMAAHFLERLEERPELVAKSELVIRDGDLEWPVGSSSVDLVFASRSAHWLDPSHVRDELIRVARPGACLLLGRVVRGSDHPRPWLRRQVHRALQSRGLTPKDGPRRGGELVFAIAQAAPNSRWISRQRVLEWHFSAAPRPILEGWRNKPSLAGLELDHAVKRAVLDEVEGLALQHFGALETELACSEGYAIEGVQLAPSGARGEPTLNAPFPIRLASRFGPELDPSLHQPSGTS